MEEGEEEEEEGGAEEEDEAEGENGNAVRCHWRSYKLYPHGFPTISAGKMVSLAL